MKKKFLMLAALLVVALGLVGVTYAWLTDTGESTVDFTVGDISYTVTPPTAASAPVVPGQSLSDGYGIVNKSNVASQLRIKVEVTRTLDGATIDWTAGTAATDHLLLTTATDWVTVEGEDYLYYKGKDAATGTIAAATGEETTLASPFGSLIINGAVVGNADAGATISVTITFEAKQAEYVTWEQMGSINFETGLAA